MSKYTSKYQKHLGHLIIRAKNVWKRLRGLDDKAQQILEEEEADE
jgi:hypothetical protein